MPREEPIEPTYRHARASDYGRPGGPWDGPALDNGLGAATTTAAIEDDRCLDAAAIDGAVDGVARWLMSCDIRAGSVVSWQLPNGLDAYLLYRACWRLGAVAAPVHHAAGTADVSAALEQVTPDLLVVGRGLSAAARPDASLLTGEEGWYEPVAPLDRTAVDPAAPAVVLFTSGSSGRPKAVVHTHRGLLSKARTMTAVHGLTPADVVLMPAPLAHISGLLNGVLVAGAAGMTSVLMARWDPAVAVDLIERHGVSFMIGPPTFFVSLMGATGFSAARVASLRLISSGGSGVTPAFVESAAAAMDCTVKRTYGSTEAPTVTTSASGDAAKRARETDGHPTGEAEVRISDPADGSPRAAGVVGEVWVRGPEVFEGYLDPDATATAFTEDGWFRTGDLGWVDADDWLTISGRMKDVIIRGGENITAAEIESVLEAHPSIRQATAVGYPDERLGQRVCAFVVADGIEFDLAACQAWMEERGITRFKWPERVVCVESLPLMGSGKVDRAALERRAAAST